jgi:hypothetical protein
MSYKYDKYHKKQNNCDELASSNNYINDIIF